MPPARDHNDAKRLSEVNRVLARAHETPYYQERLRGLPKRIDDLTELAAFPTTSKADVVGDVDAHPPYGSRVRVGIADIRHIVTTSGTSGAGEEVYPLDAEDEVRIIEMEAVGFGWAGIDASSVVLNTLPLSTTAAGQWYYHGLRRLGATVLAVGTYPTERKLDYLTRFRAETVVGTPSYVCSMAIAARRAGLEPSELGVRRLVVAGESWSETWLARLEVLWGARVFEQYGCTQRAMAWSCPAGALTPAGRGVLHALSDHGVYEVVEPQTGRPVTEGEGELVVTPFVCSASPLVRFATGDRVRVVHSCGCGRTGPCFQAGAIDRYDFMVKVRGVNVWPEALDKAVFSVRAVRDYEACVTTGEGGRETLTVEVEVELDDDEREAGPGVARAVERLIGLHAGVVVVPHGTIAERAQDRFHKRRRLLDRREVHAA